MDPQLNLPILCKYCSQPVDKDAYFCPSCGKKLKEKEASLSAGALLWLFILSTLLPPLGLGVTIRYIKSEDEKAKMIGWISLIVMILAILIGIWVAKGAMDNFNQQLNSQLQNYNF